jgi:hypothetical protein
VMAESRQPTEAAVRELSDIYGRGTFARDSRVTDLCDSWLAQRDVVAAAQELADACEAEFMSSLTEALDEYGEPSMPDDEEVAAPNSHITFGMIRRARAAVAAVVSGTPERPTRFCGVCGHPSVSAYAGGWKCRDCGAVVSGTPEGEKHG